jgi:hypothetical protein
MGDIETNASDVTAQDQLFADILSRSSQSAASSSSQPQGASPQPDILSTLLSNKELIARLPQIISVAKPMLELLGSQTNLKKDTETKSDPLPTSARPAESQRSASDANRAALLCAMKPYLSRDRQNAIDYIIKLSRLDDILKTL